MRYIGMQVLDCSDQILAHTVGRVKPKFLARVVENIDCAGLGGGELHRLSDDSVEHSFEIEG